MNPIKLLTLAAPLFLTACLEAAGTSEKLSRIEGTGYAISAPASWVVTRFPDDADCISLKKLPRPDNQEFTLMICLNHGEPTEIANSRGFFYKENNWVHAGSMDEQPAELKSISGLPVITGKSTCGITNEFGFQAAGGLCFFAIVFADGYAVSLETDGTETSHAEAEKILDSIIVWKPTSKPIHNLLGPHPSS